jgi:predicted ATPase/class 3 adenylate cyclase
MVELPTGTVTFLFTDIEGSTHLLRELGRETYSRVQDDHGEILRTAIAERHGVEVRTEGDSFFAVFPTPGDALTAAVQAQRNLTDHAWPDGVTVRVRMGLHTGEGVVGAGGSDYVGIDVNRAARIAAAGHGGQVLLSHALRGLVEHTLPTGVAIRDLGNHRLKDIEHLEHIHDVVISGLPSDFPAVKSLDVRLTNLLPQRTSFVGRERELIEINKLLDGTRLLTLTGPGGTGKTRLALKLAADSLDRFPNGVFVVDLGAISEPGLVLPEIAAALRVREVPGRDLASSLFDHVRDSTMLLVLDNLEQLLGAAPTVGRLLDAAPKLTILATSRVPLHISGEQEYRVSPLPLPESKHRGDPDRLTESDSVRLFVQRAAAVRPGFRVTYQTAPVVAEIAARVDGLPLALELAASRIKILSPGELAARLQDRLPILTGGPRDAPKRHRTLRETIQWSHDLLAPEEQRLFARLSVFADGWTLEAAEEICGPGLDVIEGLESLVDASLVNRKDLPDGVIRFGMLETIREYAQESLAASGEEEVIRRRHAEFIRDKAEEAEPNLAQPEWLNFFEVEHDNVRAALDWAEKTGHAATALRTASALWRFWLERGHLEEGRERLNRLVALPEAQGRDQIRSRALGALGGIAWWQNDYEVTRRAYEEAVEIARELGDSRLLSHALYDVSFISTVLEGDLNRSKELLRESLMLADPDDRILAGRIWTAMVFIATFLGPPANAIDPIRKALDIHRELGNSLLVADNLILLAGMEIVSGHLDAARDHVQEAARIRAGAESPISFATVLIALAFVANVDGRYRRCARLLGAWQMMKEAGGGGPPPVAVAQFGDPEAEARAALGDEEYERVWAEGHAMTMDEAVAYALEG